MSADILFGATHCQSFSSGTSEGEEPMEGDGSRQFTFQDGHKPGNLEYSGNSLNLENLGNSQGILCNLREKL